MTRLPGARRSRHRWRWRDWRAAARLLQVRSARVAVLDRSTDGAPDGVLALRCDVTDTPAVDARGHVSQNNDAEWARVLDVNVTGIARVIRAALPHLRRSPHAAVVNTCSAVAFMWTSFPWPSYPRAFVGNHVGIPRVCRWACKSRQRSPAKHCVWPISRPSPECHDPTRRRRLNRP